MIIEKETIWHVDVGSRFPEKRIEKLVLQMQPCLGRRSVRTSFRKERENGWGGRGSATGICFGSMGDVVMRDVLYFFNVKLTFAP